MSNNSTPTSRIFSSLHLEYLEKRGIRPQDAEAAGWRTVSAREWQHLKDQYTGLPAYNCEALFVPYSDAADGIPRCRVRPDDDHFWKGGADSGTEEKKVEIPRWVTGSASVVPYIPPQMDVARYLSNPNVPAFIVEAPAKAMALMGHGMFAIGMGGIYAGFRDPGTDRMTTELARVEWRGRETFVVYDAGINNNPGVADAAARLAKVLRDAGAVVRIVTLPLLRATTVESASGMHIYTDADQGPDDYLAQHTMDAWIELVWSAVPADPIQRVRETSGAKVERTTEVARMLESLYFVAALRLGGATAIDQISQLTNLSKKALKEEIREFAARLSSESEEDSLAGLNEVELARVLIERLGRAVFTEGSFFQYEDGIWRKLDTPAVRKMTHAFDGVHLTDRKIRGILNIASDLVAEPRFFERAAPGLAFTDGFVTISKEGIKFAAHDPEYRARHRYEGRYGGEHAAPGRFLAMLDGYFAGDDDAAEKIAAIQEQLGRGMFGLGARQDGMVLVLVGEGNDGKSTICHIYKDLLPPNSTCSVPPQQIAHEYYRAELAGKIANIVADAPTREMLDTGPLKAVVSGDHLSGRRPGEPVFEFRPRALHIFCFNRELPPVSDRSGGMRKRFRIIRFNNSIPRDAENADIVTTIADEKLSIVQWLIEGAQRSLVRRTVPPSAEREVQAWFDDDDPIAHWLAGYTIVQSGNPSTDWARAADVYEKFRDWYARNNPSGRCLSSTKFGKRLKRDHKVPSAVTKRGTFYALVDNQTHHRMEAEARLQIEVEEVLAADPLVLDEMLDKARRAMRNV